MERIRNLNLPLVVVLVAVSFSQSETVEIYHRKFEIPDGYELKLAIEPGLTERPIVVDFDQDGNLYVAESSGTNDNVQQQLKEKPHSILRLRDTNGDGIFDKRTVFADRMMFPEGVLCHRGSVFVSAPPQIWKLTDNDHDGVADEREVWFDAKTLTGCANDLHGPYLGLDGWIYWCKGAFAEQSYERPNGRPFVTQASHIFRRWPDGGTVQPVMTGGMDNPVEVAFTETGERIFNTTFFQHPANGQRDGLVHAIYGGVYGKDHGVLDGHPRTGPLMPVMTHLGAAAPSGLARLESNALGYENQLLTACFNLHSVTRHELVAQGSTFQTKDSVLVSSDDLDFHPTDVIEDADGSVLIVDTGGWYKLCCPTSQLHKPDVPGAIYRLTKIDAERNSDPRGLKIGWSQSSSDQLAKLLADGRPAVRKRAIEGLGQRADAVPVLRQVVGSGKSYRAALNAVWAACRISTPPAREVARLGLHHQHANVRQAAAHAVSLYPWGRSDRGVEDWGVESSGVGSAERSTTLRLIELLGDDSLHVQRAAAEAIGRLGVKDAVPRVLDRLDDDDIDRTLQHSLIYALIEIGPDAAVQLVPVLTKGTAKQRRAALTALLGMPNGEQAVPENVLLELLASRDSELRSLAIRVAKQRPEWNASFVNLYRRELQKDSKRLVEFGPNLAALAKHSEIDHFIVELLKTQETEDELVTLIRAVPPSSNAIDKAFPALLHKGKPTIVSAVVRKLAGENELSENLQSELLRVVKSSKLDAETRLLAARQFSKLDAELFVIVTQFFSSDEPRVRSLAMSVLETSKLDNTQLLKLAKQVQTVGALELSRLLRVFEKTKASDVGRALFESLSTAPTASALPPHQLTALAKQFGDPVEEVARPLLAMTKVDAEAKSNRLATLFDTLPKGNIRRGQKLFHDQKLACFACHAVGYRGGTVGPDLSRIGRTRSRRDLLEAILYPSASFVRSYEPVNVLTEDGRQWSGTIRNQSSQQLTLQLNATDTKTLATDEIEELVPGTVSIMPSGLDKQLSNEELADLLAFLESRK